ncbi:MAG: aminotransferase class III-fold pyridoxal phosphate-dependent enzyme [Pseudomonadota bacterium]
MDQTDADVVARDARVFFHQSTSSPVRRTIVEARGTRFKDSDGHWVFDAHGNGCHLLGYGHPRLLVAAAEQMASLPFAPRRFTNPIAVDLAERLVGAWPWGEARVLFAPSGSDAIEIGLKLARLATGRHGVVAFEGSWHGAGLGALAVGGRAHERPPVLGPLLPDCHHLPALALWNGPDVLEASALAALTALEALLERHREIGLLVAEPQPAAPTTPPAWFWPRFRALLDAHAVLLLFDEIPRGLGRSGHFFTAEATGIAPDFVAVGKALGGALVPLAALVGRAELNVGGDLGIGHYTHEKSTLGCRIGFEVLEILQDQKLLPRACRIGARLVTGLKAEFGTDGVVTAIGHQGASVSLALRESVATQTTALVERLYRAGLNVTASGGQMTLVFPLVTTDGEIDEVARVLATALYERWT